MPVFVTVKWVTFVIGNVYNVYSHNNMDSESAQTETATVEEDYTRSVLWVLIA